MSDRVGNGTRYTLTENALFKQMGRFRCVCFEESSVTTEDGSTEPRSIKHWSQLLAIGSELQYHTICPEIYKRNFNSISLMADV